tara:strand:- start:320 stop:1078 length:759 start_codon:yes stop_codon:yes gene_type:complete
MSTVVIIPARLGSSRLPGKPLLTIGELPLVIHVYNQVSLCRGVDEICIATDSTEVLQICNAHNVTAMLTETHPSGTDRVAEAARNIKANWVVNVQGDEPFIDPRDIQTIIDQLKASQTDLVTLRLPIKSPQELNDPNIVKVVCQNNGRALYFSRAAIPYDRDRDSACNHSFRHVGIYGYRNSVLQELTQLPVHPLEDREKLEQLRALAHGKTIGVFDAMSESRGIDTPQDLQWARQRVAQLGTAAFPSGKMK